MRKTKKALASLAIAGMVLSMAPMSVFGATTDSNRLAGAGRVETAIAIAAEGWTSADSVIVVPADDANTVDALAAAPLAGQLNAPILLTYKDALDPQVQQKIKDLGAKNVYAVGALSADTVASLKAMTGVTVTELKGADRTETAAKVAAQLTGVKGSFVVAYDGIADALSAASYAAANDYSIVVANPDGTIPASEKVTGTVYTVGGQVKYDGAKALSGADRYATNDAVVDGLDFDFGTVYVANGQNPVDALAGAPLAAQKKSPIVLGDAYDVATGANDNLTSTSKVIALGGVGAVPESALAKVAYQAPATLAVESVSAINSITVAVKFNQPVDQGTAENISNYSVTKVDGSALAFDATTPAELQDDNQTVYLNLAKATNALPKVATSYTVYVHDVNTVNGDAMDKYKQVVTLKDDVRATVTDAAFTNNNVYELKFSEPLQVVDNTTVKVYQGLTDVTSSVTIGTNSDHTNATISGTAALDETKTYTVQVLNALDYSGNVLTPNPYKKDFTITKDTTAPKVSSVTDVNLRAFKVKFDEPIDTTGAAFVVQIDDVTKAVVPTVVSDTNDTEFTVDLGAGNELSSGLHKVAVTTFSDVSGNAQTKGYAEYIKFADAKPALTSTTGVIKTLGGTKYAVFTFDRDLDNSYTGITGANITAARTDSDGISYDVPLTMANFKLGVAGTVAGLEDNQLALDLTNYSTGDFTMTLPATFVTAYGSTSKSADVAFSYGSTSSTVELNKTVSLNMTGSPAVIDTTAAINHDDASEASVNEIVLTFTGDLNDTAKNVDNYKLDGVNVVKSAVFYGDKQTVKLTLNDDAVKYDGLYVLSISGLQDANGKAVKDFADTVKVLENQKPYIATAKVKTLTTVEVTFNENITNSGSITKDDFGVTVNGTQVDLASASLSGKVATVTLSNALTDTSAVVKVKTSANFDGVDTNGNTGVKENEVTATWSVGVAGPGVTGSMAVVDGVDPTPAVLGVYKVTLGGTFAAGETVVIDGKTLTTAADGTVAAASADIAAKAALDATLDAAYTITDNGDGTVTFAQKAYSGTALTAAIGTSTAGTAAAGTTTASVAANAGSAEVATLTITHDAVNAGNVVVTVGGVSKTIAVTAGELATGPSGIASAVASAFNGAVAGYNVTGSNNTVIFTSTTNANVANLTATVQ